MFFLVCFIFFNLYVLLIIIFCNIFIVNFQNKIFFFFFKGLGFIPVILLFLVVLLFNLVSDFTHCRSSTQGSVESG